MPGRTEMMAIQARQRSFSVLLHSLNACFKMLVLLLLLYVTTKYTSESQEYKML